MLTGPGWVLDNQPCTIAVGEIKLKLSWLEYDLVYTLLTAPDYKASCSTLYRALWGAKPPKNKVNTLRVNILRLRAKIAATGIKLNIKTHYGSAFYEGAYQLVVLL